MRSACAAGSHARQEAKGWRHGAGQGVRADRGAGRSGGVPGLRRERGGGHGGAGADHDPLSRRPVLHRPGTGRTRAGPRVRLRPSRRGRGHVHRARADDPGATGGLGPQRAAPHPQRTGRAEAALPAGAAALAGGADPASLAWRAQALQAAGRLRHRAPLRRLQHLLRVGARAVHGLHLRLLPRRGRDAGAGAGLQARTGGEEARAAPRDAAAGRRLRLGGMVRHAAREHGVKALGVTLSEQQAVWAQQAIEREGLSGLAEVRHLDYRNVTETGFDAVSSIGLTEHIGKAQLPAYFSFLFGKLKPGGRLLNHCITRPDNSEPARRAGGFINRYVFPDGELEGPGHLVSVMNSAGFEIRHEENLREHYARTLAGWCASLDAHWAEAVAEVGPGTARVWRLYMAGSRLGFDRNVVELHQILGVRLEADGESHMPLRPDSESAPAPVAAG